MLERVTSEQFFLLHNMPQWLTLIYTIQYMHVFRACQITSNRNTFISNKQQQQYIKLLKQLYLVSYENMLNVFYLSGTSHKQKLFRACAIVWEVYLQMSPCFHTLWSGAKESIILLGFQSHDTFRVIWRLPAITGGGRPHTYKYRNIHMYG